MCPSYGLDDYKKRTRKTTMPTYDLHLGSLRATPMQIHARFEQGSMHKLLRIVLPNPSVRDSQKAHFTPRNLDKQ